jgi:MYXO-CTERM domain-containing protein
MRHLLPAPLLLLAACDGGSFETDHGQLEISASSMVDFAAGPDGPSRFLAGTAICPSVSVSPDDRPAGDYEPLDCFAQSFAGPVEPDADCLALTGAGTVDWTFTPQACPGNDFGYAPVDDHVAIEVVAPDAVEGRLPMRVEELAESLADDPGVRLDHPDGWRLADGEPLRLVAGQPFDVQPALRTIADGVPVAWEDGTLRSDGTTVIDAEEAVGMFRLLATKGETAALTLDVAGTPFPVGTIEGVAESAVASIEIALAFAQDPDTGISSPYAARAVLRDADGALLFGAPVSWRFPKLRLATGPENGFPGRDYVSFSDECTDPATTIGEQHGTLVASVAGVSASTELVWTPRLEAAPQDGWAAAEDCQPPALCGCASGGPTPGGFTLLGLVALARRRRR